MAQEHETLKYTQEVLDWLEDRASRAVGNNKSLNKDEILSVLNDYGKRYKQESERKSGFDGFDSAQLSQMNSFNRLVDSYSYHVYTISELDRRLRARHHLDLSDKRRDLRYRLYNKLIGGVVIVAFVLLTGYLAKLWEIPLPMLRLVGQ